MKIGRLWVAYKFRDSNLETLRERLTGLRSALSARKVTMVTMVEDIQHWEWRDMPKTQVVAAAYDLAWSCDAALCIYETDEPSEGRGFDAGYYAGICRPTIMAIKRPLEIPYTEALFTQNPANIRFGIEGVVRYERLEDVALIFNG